MSQTFLTAVGNGYVPNPDDNVYDSIFKEYERAVMKSILGAFGFDFLVQDRHGGDVDTVHNVRQIGIDPLMDYKNPQNETNYELRPAYDKEAYHNRNEDYQTFKHFARGMAAEIGGFPDEYTGLPVHFTKAKNAPAHVKASVDHVVSAYELSEDRGRVLSGLKGEDLANIPENLAITNSSLNSSMGATKKDGVPVSNREYVERNPDLPEEIKQNIIDADDAAREAIETKINKAYYSNSSFWKDTASAAGKIAVAMAVRQALAQVFMEVWFAVREELAAREKQDMKSLFHAIAEGIKKGFAAAKENYQDVLGNFFSGGVSGIFSSLTTTLCNIFLTTAKNVVKVIRESYASLVEAGRILLFNPAGYLFGDRLRAAAKILSTGAGVVAGSLLKSALDATSLGAIPIVGDMLSTACGALVSALLSCSLLLYLDRSKWINNLVERCNRLPCIEKSIAYFREQAEYFTRYAAELEKIDLDKLEMEIGLFSALADKLDTANSPQELNSFLRDILEKLELSLPWEGNFDSFMRDKDTKLVFS